METTKVEWVSWDNGKENGNYKSRVGWDNGKENGNYYRVGIMGCKLLKYSGYHGISGKENGNY